MNRHIEKFAKKFKVKTPKMIREDIARALKEEYDAVVNACVSAAKDGEFETVMTISDKAVDNAFRILDTLGLTYKMKTRNKREAEIMIHWRVEEPDAKSGRFVDKLADRAWKEFLKNTKAFFDITDEQIKAAILLDQNCAVMDLSWEYFVLAREVYGANRFSVDPYGGHVDPRSFDTVRTIIKWQ